MSSLNPQPEASTDDELLVSYLDGELSPDESKRIEQRLAGDEGLRNRLRDLDQAWEALDSLPPATLRDDFARTTIEMVSLAAQKDVSARRAVAATGNRRRAWVAAIAGLACLAIGFFAIRALPDSNRRLVDDLPVILQADLLAQVPDIDFLRRLSSTASIEQLANDEQRLDHELSRVTLVRGQAPHQRAPEIENLPPEEKASLEAQADRFWDRDAQEQDRLRELQREIATAADREQLERTLLAYGQWLERRQPGERRELRSGELNNDQRLQRVAHLMKEDDRQAARTLSPEDAKHLREEIFAIADERRPDWVDDHRGGKGRHKGWAFIIVARVLNDDETDDRTRERLTSVLSETAQKHLRTMRRQRDQRLQLLKWMADSARLERGPEALEAFFDAKLSDDQRARLLNLPPGQMEAELERLYFADQLGERGREWLRGFGSPPWDREGRDRNRPDGPPRRDGADRGRRDGPEHFAPQRGPRPGEFRGDGPSPHGPPPHGPPMGPPPPEDRREPNRPI